MKKNIIAVTALFLISCCKDDNIDLPNGDYLESIPPIWKRSLHDDGLFHSNSSIPSDIIYEGNVVIATTSGSEERLISLINSKDGGEIWRWNDIFNPQTEYFDIIYPYIHEDLLTYQVGSRSYCLNLSNGSTEWKIRRDDSFDNEISGIGFVYYTIGPAIDTLTQFETQVGYKGNLQTGEISQFLIPFFSGDFIGPGNLLGGVTNIIPYIDSSDTLLVITYSEPLPEWHIASYLGLYNESKDTWIYDRILLAEPTQLSSVFHPPVIDDSKVIIQVGNGIVCHDLYTGSKLWGNFTFKNDFLFSGFIVRNHVIYANNEDKHLYALDLSYGNIMWKTETAGSSSRLRYLNDVIYLNGGSDGKLHAIDVLNGRTVWKINHKLIGDESQLGFKSGDIYVLEGTNNQTDIVISCTHMNAYCFEAYR